MSTASGPAKVLAPLRFVVITGASVLATLVTRTPLGGGWVWGALAVVLSAVVAREYRRLKKALGIDYLLLAGVALAILVETFWMARYGYVHTAWWFVPLYIVFYARALKPAVLALIRFTARHPKSCAPLVWAIGAVSALAGPRREGVLATALGYALFVPVSIEQFKWGVPIRDCAKPAPGVQRSTVFSSCHVDNWGLAYARLPGAPSRPGGSSRDAFPDGQGHLVYLTGWWDEPDPALSPIVWLSEDGGAVLRTAWARGPLAGACQPGTDRCVVSSSITNSLIVLDARAMEVTETIRFPGFSPDEIDRDADGRITLVMGPGGESPGPAVPGEPERLVEVPSRGASHVLLTFDLESNAMQFVPLFGTVKVGSGAMYFARALPKGGMVIGSNPIVADPAGGSIRNVSFGRLWSLASGDVACGAAVRRETSAESSRVWISYTFAGRIVELDGNLRLLRTFQVPLGTRQLEDDPARNVLLAGGYDDGEVYALDLASGAVVTRWNVGSQIRQIHVDGDRAIVTSGAGGVTVIDLAVALPGRALTGARPDEVPATP